jgi:glucose-1-phosphate cytidylyltransferase
MMPISGMPILVHIMRLYAHQGFTNFVLAAGHRKEILHDYFEGRFRDWSVRIVDTGQDSDTGERIRRCREHVSDTFFATYGDGIGDVRLRELLSFHRRAGGLATVTSVPLRSQYGTVVSDELGCVREFREKPVIREHWINAGFFVFERRAFDVWEGTNLENHALPALVRRGELFTYRHEGFWKSMDTSKDQQELERLHESGEASWEVDRATTSATTRRRRRPNRSRAFPGFWASPCTRIRSGATARCWSPARPGCSAAGWCGNWRRVAPGSWRWSATARRAACSCASAGTSACRW